MKQTIITLSLIILCTQHALFAMELDSKTKTTQQTAQPVSELEIFTKINDAINTKYAFANNKYAFANNYVADISDNLTARYLTSQECLDITMITENNCPTKTAMNIFYTLYEKNIFFKKAVDYFLILASKNLEMVTTDNITTIENSKKMQPILELNSLSLQIKNYIMHCVLYQKKHTHTIILSGHEDPIATFDICETTDQAVTSSFNPNNPCQYAWNSLFLLWDLKTGKPIHTFDEKSPINLLAFNPNGSSIAAAMYNENAIKIWSTANKQVLHKFLAGSIGRLAYSHPTGSVITAISNINTPEQAILSQWTLAESKPGEVLNSAHITYGRQKNSNFQGTKYLAHNPCGYLTSKNKLYITKQNCTALYLCQKSIEKSLVPKIREIERSASFHRLTDTEKTDVRNDTHKKNAALEKKNPQKTPLLINM